MRHPKDSELALYAGDDLGFWSRRRVKGHLRDCARCREEVEALGEASIELREAARELPADLNWARLAAEMRANVRLGFTAGELVGPAPKPVHTFGFRQAMAVASVIVLILAGWWLNVPQPTRQPREAAGAVLEQTAEGIEVHENGRSMTVLVPSDRVLMSVSTQGSLGARYVDSETGQVTISNVYAQ